MDLNQELKQMNEKHLRTFLLETVEYISESSRGRISLSQQDKESIVNIATMCVNFDIVNPIKINKKIESQATDEKNRLLLYTASWLNKLAMQKCNSFLLRQAPKLNDRDIVRDPALSLVLENYYKENNISITGLEISKILDSHDLLMSIENIQGYLLEAYIASVICVPPFNLIWLEGEVVKAADFALYYNNSLILIQIKNKYNTENSSSSKIREGAPVEIKKWYRLGKKKVNGINEPIYMWENLNSAIESLTTKNPELSEKKYREFLKQVVKKNPKIINI